MALLASGGCESPEYSRHGIAGSGGRIGPGSGGGHFTVHVVSPVFEGKSMLESQRLVLGAIAHLMKGDGAPVHAIDSLKTKTA